MENLRELQVKARLAEGQVKTWVDSVMSVGSMTLAAMALCISALNGAEGAVLRVGSIGTFVAGVLLVVCAIWGLGTRKARIREWILIEEEVAKARARVSVAAEQPE